MARCLDRVEGRAAHTALCHLGETSYTAVEQLLLAVSGPEGSHFDILILHPQPQNDPQTQKPLSLSVEIIDAALTPFNALWHAEAKSNLLHRNLAMRTCPVQLQLYGSSLNPNFKLHQPSYRAKALGQSSNASNPHFHPNPKALNLLVRERECKRLLRPSRSLIPSAMLL